MRPSRFSISGARTAGSWSQCCPDRPVSSWWPTSSDQRRADVAWTDRLTELGIELPAVPAPAGAYVPAVRTGSLVYTAGQVPFVNGAVAATGKVGAEISPEEAKGHARTCALN